MVTNILEPVELIDGRAQALVGLDLATPLRVIYTFTHCTHVHEVDFDYMALHVTYSVKF